MKPSNPLSGRSRPSASLNVSEAAEACIPRSRVSPSRSACLRDELGITVFERSGKRLTGITEPGQAVLAAAHPARGRESPSGREEYAGEDAGSRNIATTHTQARYALPAVVSRFLERWPKVRLTLHQAARRRLPNGRFPARPICHRHRSARPVSRH